MKRTVLGSLLGLCLLTGPAFAQGAPGQAPGQAPNQIDDPPVAKPEEMGEKTITLDQVPPAARSRIEKEAKGQTITKVEQADKNGQTVFEAQVRSADNKMSEIDVSADGKVLKHERGKEYGK